MTPIFDQMIVEFGNPFKDVIGRMTPRQRRRADKKARRLTGQVLRG